jgi:hypothetical protein
VLDGTPDALFRERRDFASHVGRLDTIARQLSQRPLKHLGRLAALNQVLIIDDHGGNRPDAAIRVKLLAATC